MTLKKKLRMQEKKAFRKRVSNVLSELTVTLDEDFDGRKIYSNAISDNDRQRLYTLWVWKEKYKVPIRWMLNLLLPIYHKKFARYTMNRKGLGVKIPTLVGKKSEMIVKEHVLKQFPDGENYAEALQDRRRDLIEARLGEEDEFVVRRKELFDFPTPDAYAKYYSRRIKNTRKEMAQVVSQAQRTRKPYRGNPFL